MLARFPNTMKAAAAFLDQHPDATAFGVERDDEPRAVRVVIGFGDWRSAVRVRADDEDSPSRLVHIFNRHARWIEAHRPAARTHRPFWLRDARGPALAGA